MTTLGFQAIGGLEIIESGLNDLRRSQLMIIPEFKYMFGAIQKHHSDLKFAHITGKAKDLLDQAVRDTKFYNILIKMLCEVKQRRTGEQRAGLRQVYTWYQANKHVLYCGPRFGKDFMREQAKEILHKSMSTKSKKRTVSARERLAGNRNFSEHLSLENADTNTVKENLDPQNSTMGPKDVNIVSVQDIFNNDAHPSDVNKNMEETQVTFKDDSSYTSSEPKVARPKSAISVTISHLNEKSGNPLAQKVTTMIHPLSALVNPHAHIASALEDKSMNKTKSVISHISSVSKPDNLQSWQAFMKNRSYGQDIVGKLNFVGRSGTALDVRYSAHSYGESPEAYTKELMDQHVKQLNASENMLSSDEDEENYLVRQTLEEFYQTADIMRPTTRNSSRMSSHSRVRSARGERIDTKPAQEVAPIAKQPLKLGHQLDLLPSNINSSPVPPKDIGIKLNTVVNNIDSVSEEMTYFKEKLVSHPQHGFRQPSVAGLPTPRDEITNTHNFVQSSSDLSSIKSRPVTASYTTDKELTTQQLQKSKLRCKSASGIDWRGRIEPDSVRYKWSKTKFGSHTYLKKWIGVHTQPSGKSSSKARPKTAPSSVKEKLKTQKEQNVRAVQAASHDTTVVDQKDVENMMTIQHLLPGDDGVDPRLLYDYDQKFWKNVRKSSVSSATELPKEFLSFVSSSTMLDKKKSSHSILGDQKTQQVYKDARSEIHTSFVNDEEHCKENTIETEENVELQKTLNEHFSSEIYPEKQKAEITFAEFSETLNPKATYQQEESEDLVHLPAKLQLSTDKNNNNLDKSTDLLPHHFSDVQLNQDILCSDCQSQDKMKTARVERSAGRMPPRSLSAHLTGYNRVTEVLRKAPPLRTPPSIPSPQLYFQTPERKSGQIFVELEHHARRTKSPKSFMQKVEGLRSVSSIHQSPIPNKTSNESIIGTSLQVCRLPVARKTPTAQLLSDFNLDFTDRNVTDQTYLSSSAQYLKHKHVSFSDLQQTHPKSTSAPTSSPRSSLEEAELRNAFSRQSRVEDSSSTANKSLARIGRPIAQVMQVTDPEELQKAAQLQREAAAAVDIQRIFRGYVARTAYKCLLPEERWKREDDQKAALEIQRMNKEHNQRMNAIYSRPPLSPDIKQWSNDVRSIQLEKALQRQDKMDQLANEMIINQKESKNKLSSIGPHVEIYDIYHPKQVGPTMKEYHQAAIKIQKIVRGWMVRRKIEKLARKATWYGSNFLKMAREYKFMLKQVQSQHGVDKPKSQFSIKDFNNYIDIRRRYEIVFEKKAFSGELEVAELKSFFTECGLHPSQTEIDEALDVTTHGQAYKTENKGLKKRELLDLLFYIYVPPATGLQGTRKSTWMNPIINGEEGRKLFGSEFVEPAPLEPCAKLVIQAKREQRQKEQAIKEAEERKRIEESLQRTEEKKQAKKSKQALIQDPSV